MDVTIPGVIVICGLQGGGKSHLIRYIMHEHRRKFDWGVVFSNTGFSDGSFDYVDKEYVYPKYSEQVLAGLKKIHEQLITDGQKPSGFVIFDDCLYGKQWQSEELCSLITQVRHYNITVIISAQNPKQIPTDFRNQVFLTVMFNMPNAHAIQSLYLAYGAMFDTYKDFKDFLLKNTAGHNFICYYPRNGGTTIESRYKVMEAPANIPRFKMRF